MNFKIQAQLFNQAVFSTWAKGRDKNLDILRIKRAFNMKEKPWRAIIKGNHNYFLEGWESEFKL